MMIKGKKLTHNICIIIICLFVITAAFPAGLADGGGSIGNGRSGIYRSAPAEIHPEVANLLHAGNDEPVGALIMLKERAATEKIADAAKRYIGSYATAEQEKSVTRRAVVTTLQDVAEKTQEPLLNYLKSGKRKGTVLEFKNFYIVNSVYVKASPQIIEALAWLPAVERILPERTFTLQEPEQDVLLNGADTFPAGVTAEQDIAQTVTEPAGATAEWGIRRIEADRVWEDFDITGEGVVIGVMDTGAVWDHPALKEKWRGYDPGDPDNPDPVFNWFDPVYRREMPRDVHARSGGYHGTHVTGTAIGSAGSNLIGTAPGAQWIAANVFNTSLEASNILIMEAGEYLLAPTCADGVPHPDMAPHIINASWGAEATGNRSEDEELRGMVQSWRDAGILPVFAACNYGPSSGTIGTPAMFPESFAVGATNSGDSIYRSSARGPVSYYPGEIKPNISAPGVSIRSAYNTSSYRTKDGTSMATPHVAGTAALMLEANPELTPEELEVIMTETATPLPNPDSPPGNTYGYGLVNAYNAVESILYNIVYFADPNLEEVIREKLDKTEDSIVAEDMAALTDLDASASGIKNLTGLEHAVNLKNLNLSDNEISDISPMNNLIMLADINLSRNNITDISSLIANLDNGGFGEGGTIDLRYNRLDLLGDNGILADIEQLKSGGVEVFYGLQVLPTVPRPRWDGPGVIGWEKVDNAAGYELALYSSNELIHTQSAAFNDLQHDFSGRMKENGKGSYTVTVRAKGDGDLYTDGVSSEKSPVYNPVKLSWVDKPIWNNSTITWNPVEGTNSYRIRLYKDDDPEPLQTVSLTNIPGVRSYDFTDIIANQEEHGLYTATVRPLGDGIIYTDGDPSEASEPYDPGENTPEPDPYEEAAAAVDALFDGYELASGVTEADIDHAHNLVTALEESTEKNTLLAKTEQAYELLDTTVQDPTTGVVLDKSLLKLIEGETALLLATVYPDSAANKNVTWSSDNEEIATVNRHGLVTAVNPGIARVTVKTEDGGHTAQCVIEVPQTGTIPDAHFTDPPASGTGIPVNRVIRIFYNMEVQPGPDFNNITLKYNGTVHPIEEKVIDETNNSVLWIKPEGHLNYAKDYTVIIPAGSVRDENDNENVEFRFTFETVEEPDEPLMVDGLSLNAREFTLIAGSATAVLVPMVEPEQANGWEITWESENDSVATVTKNRAGDGIVTPLATGKTIITAIVEHEGVTFEAHCYVDVIKFGDITGSGSIEVGDAIMLLRYVVDLAQLDELQLEAGRVAGGNEITVADAIVILRYIVGLAEVT